MRLKYALMFLLMLVACMSDDTSSDFYGYLNEDSGIHIASYSSKKMVIIEYSATSWEPSLTEQAIDMADKRCGYYGRNAVHQKGEVFKQYSFNEKHTFSCEPIKRTKKISTNMPRLEPIK